MIISFFFAELSLDVRIMLQKQINKMLQQEFLWLLEMGLVIQKLIYYIGR